MKCTKYPVLWINLVPPQFPVDRPEQNTQGKGTVTKFPILVKAPSLSSRSLLLETPLENRYFVNSPLIAIFFHRLLLAVETRPIGFCKSNDREIQYAGGLFDIKQMALPTSLLATHK
jgi:hypothetical protein